MSFKYVRNTKDNDMIRLSYSVIKPREKGTNQCYVCKTKFVLNVNEGLMFCSPSCRLIFVTEGKTK